MFVDRVVTGDLPLVCAKTGAPAARNMRLSTSVRSVGWAWLLVFAGPPGWLALLVVLWIGGERFEGRVPMSEEAFDRIRRRTRGAWIALAAAVGAFALTMWLQFPDLGVLGVLALVAVMVLLIGANWASVELKLDASRRWVTIAGVHPDFAAAVKDEAARHQAHSPI